MVTEYYSIFLLKKKYSIVRNFKYVTALFALLFLCPLYQLVDPLLHSILWWVSSLTKHVVNDHHVRTQLNLCLIQWDTIVGAQFALHHVAELEY